MELTYRLFSRPQADEIRDIYLRQAEEYDVHRAAMFFLLIKFSYSSSCKSFGCQPCSIRGVFGQIWEMSRRLDGVDIENQDFEVIRRILRANMSMTAGSRGRITSVCGKRWAA